MVMVGFFFFFVQFTSLLLRTETNDSETLSNRCFIETVRRCNETKNIFTENISIKLFMGGIRSTQN